MADEKKAKDATDLAKDAKDEQVGVTPDVSQAGAARVASMDQVDQLAEDERSVLGAKTSEGKERGPRKRNRYAGKSFVALHAMLRDGAPVYPGDVVKFDDDEEEHVADLLQQHVVVEGAEGSEEVKEALGQADLARGRAFAKSGGA